MVAALLQFPLPYINVVPTLLFSASLLLPSFPAAAAVAVAAKVARHFIQNQLLVHAGFVLMVANRHATQL